MTSDKTTIWRRYNPECKAQLASECDGPGALVAKAAKVALSQGSGGQAAR